VLEQQALADHGHCNERWEALVSQSADVAVIADANCSLQYVAPAATRVFGWHPDEVRDRIGLDLVHPDDLPAVVDALGQAIADPDKHPIIEFRLRHKDGSWRWVEETISNLLDHPAVGGLVGNLRDITERRAVLEQLRTSETLYRTIVETSQEGIVVVDVDGNVSLANERFASLLGRDVAGLVGKPVARLLPPGVHEQRLASRRWGAKDRYEVSFTAADGVARHLLISANPLYDEAGAYLGSLAMCADITDRKLAEQELTRLALTDPLTGLANRTMLTARLREAFVEARENQGRLGLLFIDLDAFKAVNDSLGHAAGDELLVATACRLAELVRPGDVIGRFGGDEFVVVAGDVLSARDLHELADRICKALSRPVYISDVKLISTASIGIAVACPDASSPAPEQAADDLLRHADVALYAAKAKGGACWEQYRPHTEQRTDQLQLASDLREATEQSQLRLWYQPIVDVHTGEAVAVEALLRWQHPTRGLLTPDAFIPLAERTGVIGELDHWVLSEACRQAAHWNRASHRQRPISVAVNISARLLADQALPDKVKAVLGKTGIAGEQLILEVTETAVMADADGALSVLCALKDLGVRLAIDDFGTGYSSLVYLKRFPVDELKIDRSFIDGLGTDPEDSAIVASVLGLARGVGVAAVAEGVETEEQRQALAALGCRLAQGYLWSPPQPPERLFVSDPSLTQIVAPRDPDDAEQAILDRH
jgi:diguanylate cyclase (GGDEF)-like protein/PAS domain S-box-containing protein